MALGPALLTAAVANAAPIPTHLVGAWLLERIGRRFTVTAYSAISLIGVIIFALADTYSVALFGASLALGFMAAAFSFTKLVAAEQYPTRLRGSGTTFTEAVGRGIAGVLVPFFTGDLIVNRGVTAACALAVGLGIVGSVLYASFARETRGTTLEELEEAFIAPDIGVVGVAQRE